MAKVVVTINPKDNTVQYEVEGVLGGGCEDLTRVLMQRNEVLEHQYTSEFCGENERPDFINAGTGGEE